MALHLPPAPSPAIDAEFTQAFSHGEAAERPVEHHCQICPTCGHTLDSRRCKLICAHCGYYMSCADYY